MTTTGALNESQNTQYSCGYYVVAFLDILGQADAMKKWCELPNDEQQRQDFICALKESVGVYIGLNKHVDVFLKAAQSKENAIWKHIIKHERNFLEKQIKRQRFSDGFILYSTIASETGLQGISNVRNIIIGCAAIMLTTLASTHPVRGGIAILPAGEFYTDELYGPAIAQAYFLENSIAQYPRIVIDDSVLEYLTHCIKIQEQNFTSIFRKEHALVRRELALDTFGYIYEDFDGHSIVDFLGKSIHKLAPTPFTEHKLHDKIIDYTNQQLQLHKTQKNTKLTMRYLWLQKYIESQLTKELTK